MWPDARRLVDDIGHELRTPLTALQGEFEIALRSERTPERYQAVLRSGLEEIGRLSTICDELLLITLADSGGLSLHRLPADINELARDSLERASGRIDQKGITPSIQLAYAGSPVLVDSGVIGKAFDELVENAVKFTPSGGAIVVGTDAVNGSARLWVEDSGPGVPVEQFLHLLEPFYRGDPARSRDTGTGLGLCTAASLARAHGGTIRAANLPEHGARFELDLPIITEPH